MTAHTQTARYSDVAKSLHWLISLLVAIQFVTAFLLPHIGKNTPMSTVISLHFSFGTLIAIVMLIRLGYRLLHPVALEAKDANTLERVVAKSTHRLFYLILIVSPVLGWASASAHSMAVSVFGIIALPPLAAPGAQWANTAGDIHGTLMWALLWLIGLHVAAALYHHFLRRDGTLRRMLPSKAGK